MKFNQAIYLISIICWLFPTIKQRNTEFFYFFFILAISDPLRLLIYQLFGIPPGSYFPLVSFLLILCFTKRKYFIYISAAAVILTLLPNIFHWPHNTIFLITLINHGALLFLFTIMLFTKLIKLRAINLFLFLIIFYEIISVFKLAAFVLSPTKGAISFSLATAVQIVFGILFSFININTKEFRLWHGKQKTNH